MGHPASGWGLDGGYWWVATIILDAAMYLKECLAGCQQCIAGGPVCACLSLQAIAAGQTARLLHAHSCPQPALASPAGSCLPRCVAPAATELLAATTVVPGMIRTEVPAPAVLFPALCAQRLTASWLHFLQLATQQRFVLHGASNKLQPSSALSTWCVQVLPVNQPAVGRCAKSRAEVLLIQWGPGQLLTHSQAK